MARPMSKSFYDWCIENKKEDWLALWDYEKNNCTPKDIGYATNKKYFFKCSKGLHEPEEKRISDLTNEKMNLRCNSCNSFYQWCIDNGKEDWLELWDYELNKCTPKDIAYASPKKYYFKCPRGLHEPEQKRIDSLTTGNTELKCNACNSIGQYLIDNYGEDALEKYWNYEKNGSLNTFENS